MLSLDQLRMFRTAAEEGSFSAAARVVGKRVSTVSAAIIALEDYLDVALFDRSTRKPTLTEDGERLYVNSQILLREVTKIERSMLPQNRDAEKTIKIGVENILPTSVFEEQINRVNQRYTDTAIHIIRSDSNSLFKQLSEESLDVLLVGTQGKLMDQFESKGVGNINLSLVCAPDSKLADLDVVPTHTLYTERQISCSSLVHNPLLSQLLIFSPEQWEASSLEDVLALVEQGLGWACVPEEIALQRQDLGFLKIIQSDLINAGVSIAVDIVELEGAEHGPVHKFFTGLYI